MERESCRSKGEPRLARGLGVETHKIDFIGEPIEIREHTGRSNHLVEFLRRCVRPRGGRSEAAIDHVDLHALHGSLTKKREILLKVFALGWEHGRNNKAHAASILLKFRKTP